MARNDEEMMTVVQIILDGVAMNEAALERNWEEARFRCQMVCVNAAEAGLTDVGLAAVALNEKLGPPGTEPNHGYGLAMLNLSERIDSVPFDVAG